MVDSIAELVGENRPVIQKAIDLTLAEMSATGALYRQGFFDPALRPFIASNSYPDRDLAWMRIKEFRPRVGHIRGTDGEVLTDRNKVEISLDELGSINVSDGVTWVEEDYLRLNKMIQLQERMANAVGVYDALLNTFLQPARDLAVGIEQTWLLMALRCVTLGDPNYTDPRSGVTYSVDYTGLVPAGNLAAALTGSNVWSNLANANGIDDLVAHLDVYYANLLRFPEAIAMSRATMNNLCSQASSKILVARNKGLITDGAVIADAANLPKPTPEEIRDVIQNQVITTNSGMPVPQFIITDGVYYNAAGTPTPFLPADYYVFLNSNMVEAAKVPTMLEIRSQITGQSMPESFGNGFTIVAKAEDSVPIRDYVKVDTAGMIICPDPRLIAARNVEDTAV
jgi:hypothetical protein